MNDATTNANPSGIKTGFLPIGRQRGGFNPAWAEAMRTSALEAIQELNLAVVTPDEPVVDDSTLRKTVSKFRAEGCDSLLVLQPSMGDGRLAPVLARLWEFPAIFWATPEKQDEPRVSSCSLTGAHNFAAIHRQFGHKFELIYGHPAQKQTRLELIRAVRITSTVKKLRRMIIGLVGGTAPGFIDMVPDPTEMNRRLGVGLVQMGLNELTHLIDSVEENEVRADAAEIETWGLPLEDGVTVDDLHMNSRYYLAIKALMKKRSLDAIAIRCWPELPNIYGHWPYLAMARLLDEGCITSLEGDTDAATGCLVTDLLEMGPSFIADWLEHDEDSITLWHPGQAPPSLCEKESLSLGMHFNIEKPLVLNGRLKTNQPVTLYRIWRCDGLYRITAAEARAIAPRRPLSGSHVTVELNGKKPRIWFEELCHEGMPHHLSLIYGHHGDTLRRFSKQADLLWSRAGE